MLLHIKSYSRKIKFFLFFGNMILQIFQNSFAKMSLRKPVKYFSPPPESSICFRSGIFYALKKFLKIFLSDFPSNHEPFGILNLKNIKKTRKFPCRFLNKKYTFNIRKKTRLISEIYYLKARCKNLLWNLK